MRLRARHLACVMLLLSTFGAADAQAYSGGTYSPRAQHIRVLLQQAAASVEDAFPHAAARLSQPALPGTPLAHTRPAWAMQPPAAHTVAQHAVTGSGL